MNRHLCILWSSDDHNQWTAEYVDKATQRTYLARATWSGSEWIIDHTNDDCSGFIELRRFPTRPQAIMDILQCAEDGVRGPKESISLYVERINNNER